MGILHRKFGLPIHVTAKTYRAAARYGLGEIAAVRHFRSGQTLRFGKVAVETIPTPHDGADGVAFVIDDGRRRLGSSPTWATFSTGWRRFWNRWTPCCWRATTTGDAGRGPYPDWLKERIRAPAGHISNVESAELLQKTASKRLQWACLAHLSEDNNTPPLALRTHRRIVGRRLPLVVATRHEATDVLEV